ncbi:phage tail protein [Enterobacter sp. 166D1]|uniref:phage tail fiber protein n=1 Tax=Enterobacter TaxID=547 RepID=UPI002A82FE12|nr:phage tail protein [Enterobacter sp. 166D1]
MSAGTITLTNGSAIVGGSGTVFTTELSAGDFIVSTVGGVSYTLPVKSVESNAQLTLVSNFTGPTQSGAAWSAVPRVALNMVTAALVAQSAEALRGLNYDKQNWQSIFSGTGNVTVTLPDGTTWTGPAWNSITSSLNSITTALSDKAAKGANNDITSLSGLTTALSVAQGGTGAKTSFDAATNLQTIRSLTYRFGSGMDPTSISFKNTSAFITGQQGYGPIGAFLDITSFDNAARMQLYGCYNSQMFPGKNSLAYATYNPNNNTWYPIAFVRDTSNTTVDSNGFIKSASPVVNVYGDGRYETNDESAGVTVTRLDVGQYLIEGCEALNSDASWGGIDGGFEIPTDRNKQPLIWLDYEVNADGSVLVKTYHREHPSAPAFARNERAGLADGEPADIPADQFVCVRVEMPTSSIWNQKQKQTEVALEQEQGS